MNQGEARTMKYARATYGSLAYDFKKVQPEADYEDVPSARPQRRA